ncbi:LOW QUALITY PROTEIN: hypothetical protein AQUCO_02900072v1 [Aquilegia coerulea]|uniref:ATP-dependent DNA helicase n=1 Tax=Aquilegia coerulea TaxID=218851 RepID=A0A2G5D377_AQUCA|nr:LOW QUALITY PROTEIN: hypothetical protein AQUCO_02900072v1 [Aquilegia coerulea]
MYIFDTDHELQHRKDENNLVNSQVLAILKQILDTYNPYVQVLRQISQHEQMQNIRLHIKELPPNERQYNMPTSSQVAAILVGEEDPIDKNDRDIIVQMPNGDLLNVPDTAGFYDPLQYHLLHPHGNFGWDLNVFDNYFYSVTCRAYYSYLLQIRNNHDSLLLRSGRLLQQYVVDNYVKIPTQRFRYLRDNQHTLRTELYQTIQQTYDKIVRADIPDPTVEPDLYRIVICHMIPWTMWKTQSSVCLYAQRRLQEVFFQNCFHQQLCKRPENGRSFINSRAIQVDNSWVVPYNAWLLRKYNCHINMEICSTIKYVKYLYKYVYKGPDRVTMEVRSADNIERESVSRIFMFPLNKMYPLVYSLDVQTPNMHELLLSENQAASDLVEDEDLSRTMLTEFFTKNSNDPLAQQYLYREFPEHYIWSLANKCWEERQGYQRVIGRLHSTSPSDGEKFYVRLLLIHKRDLTSFDDLKTIEGVMHTTFKEAAEHMGLFERDSAIFDCLTEASISHIAAALRGLFASILVFCNPAGVRHLWDEFYQYMIEDYPSSSTFIHAADSLWTWTLYYLCMTNQLLTMISHLNFLDQSSISDPIALEQSIIVSAQDIQSIHSLNEGQKFAFNQIVHSIEQNESILYFVDGLGGTAQLLREASVILWDEATMSHRFAFECLDRSLQDITDIHLPFGGKVAVLGGDFRQVLPIVRHGTVAQTISTCITSASLWKVVHILKLTENMRTRSDNSFSEYLLRVGDGLQPCILDDMIQLHHDMLIPSKGENPLSDLILAIFPSLHDNAFDRNYVIQRAIITTTNQHADSINDKIICSFPGQEYTYYSFDSVQDDDEHVYQQDYLNSLCPNGLPPHKLILKVGTPIIHLRNLDPSARLCNETRLVCQWFKHNVICAEILTGSFYGQTIPHVGIYLPDYVFSHVQLYVALSRGTTKATTKTLVNRGHLRKTADY